MISNPFKKQVRNLGLALIAVMFATSSCVTPKKVAYMQDLETGVAEYANAKADIRLRPDDKISVVVYSKDPELAALFNLPMVTHRIEGSSTRRQAVSNGNSYISYYTVDPQGNIDFPQLGEIHVEGMNRSEVAATIKTLLVKDELLKDPVVTIEFVNTGITLAGEVAQPGRYEINRDHLTILEGLGMGGDLTIQGRRENVLVIREVDGKPTAYRVDLTNAEELMKSPVYYLQQNDYVYVEPNDMKKRSSTVNGNTALSASFWVSVASLLTSVAVLIFK